MVIVGEVWIFLIIICLMSSLPYSLLAWRLFLNVYMYHQTYQHNKRETRRVYILVILFSDKVREMGEICENTTVSEQIYVFENNLDKKCLLNHCQFDSKRIFSLRIRILSYTLFSKTTNFDFQK